MSKWIVYAVALVMALGGAAAAHGQAQAGEQELGFTASYFHMFDSDSPLQDFIDDSPIDLPDSVKDAAGLRQSQLGITFRYGRYITASTQVGGGLIFAGAPENLAEDMRFELFGAYYFSPEEVNTWYTRAGYQSALGDPAEGAFQTSLGFKTYLRERIGFFWEGSYGFALQSGGNGTVGSVAGLTFLF